MELPAAHARVEDRAGAGRGQHRRAQAGRDHAADRAALRRGLPAGRPAAGRRQHRHRRRRDRAARSSSTPTSTRSRSPARPRSARRSPAPIAGTRKKATLELGGKAANIVFDDAADRPGRRGHRQRHLLQPGPRLLRRVAAAGAGERRTTRSSSGSSAGSQTLRVGDPLDKNTDVGAINSRRAARPHPRAHRRRRGRGRRALDRAVRRCRTTGSGSPQRCSPASRQTHRIAQEEIFGPVLSVLTFRTPAGGGRQGQQHAVRAVRRRLDREGLAHPVDGRPAARRRGLGQHVQPVRPDLAVRRLQGVRATAARAAATASRPTSRQEQADEPDGTAPEERLDVRKTYKLYIGGAFPRSESGRSYEVRRRRPRAASSPTPRWARARTPATPSSPPAARSAGWAAATAYNRGQVLYRVAEVMEGRRAQFVAEVAAGEGAHRARGPRRSSTQAIDRWVWYAGWTDKIAQVLGGLNPVAGPYFDISAPEPTGVVAVLAPQAVVAARAGLGRRAGRRHAATPPWSLASERAPAARRHPRRGARDVRRAGRRRQHPHRPHRRGRALARLAPRRQRDRPRRCGRAPTGVAWGDLERGRGRQPQAGAAPGRRRAPTRSSPTGPPTPDLSRIRAFLETKTVWHPKGR